MPDDNPIKYVPINQLHQEEGAHELATSPNMEPYLTFAAALMQGHDPEPELEAIRQLPFCLFLKALVGTEEMLKMMVEAIGVAKTQG
jgi:hypothetical protein